MGNGRSLPLFLDRRRCPNQSAKNRPTVIHTSAASKIFHGNDDQIPSLHPPNQRLIKNRILEFFAWKLSLNFFHCF